MHFETKYNMAIDKNIIQQIIIDNQRLVNNINLIERDFVFEGKGNYVFVGIRQAGKSYMLYQRMQHLIQEGHNIEEMVYISFDDERIFDIKANELDIILQTHQSLFECRPILFLDEIQNIDGWQYFARRLANEKYQVYITGSNAKMLSRDIATTLGGRFWVNNIYPYSFKEFLKAHNIKLERHWNIGSRKNDIVRFFNDYFYFGGFPELTNIVAKRAWLTGIYNKIFFSDIVVRNSIRNEAALRMTIRRLAESVKQPIAYNRISNLIKSTGVSTNPVTVMNYVQCLKDACMLFSVENYATKFVEKETVKKHYFIDNGLLNLFLTDPETSLLENMAAIHLHRMYGDNLFFYNKDIEVDFYIPDEKTGIQVCYNLIDNNTLEREVKALLRLKKVIGLKRMLIVSRDTSQTLNIGKDQIEVVPIWQWILENDM